MRMDYRTLGRLTALLTIAGIASACALSPQIVRIEPALAGPEAGPAHVASRIALTVADARSASVIGYRGGVYATATITAASDLEANVRRALAGAYEGMGLQIVDDGQAADVRLRVELVELSYSVEGDNFVRGVSLAAAVRAISETAARTLTANYRETLQKDVLKAPSAAENERLINAVLDKALNRLVADRRLTSLEE